MFSTMLTAAAAIFGAVDASQPDGLETVHCPASISVSARVAHVDRADNAGTAAFYADRVGVGADVGASVPDVRLTGLWRRTEILPPTRRSQALCIYDAGETGVIRLAVDGLYCAPRAAGVFRSDAEGASQCEDAASSCTFSCAARP